MYELLLGICTAGALMILEHLTMRHLPFLVRYALGMLAFLAGYGVWAWLVDDLAALGAAVAIGIGSGCFVLFAYGLRWLWRREIDAAKAAGRLQGRAEESNLGTTRITRNRDDR